MITAKARQFICCLPASSEYGFSDWSILTHAWHESGGFARTIGDYNFWGIKTPEKSVWNGKIVETWTHEDERVLPGEDKDTALVRIIKKYGVKNARIDGTVKMKSGTTYWHVGLPQQFRDWATCEQAILWYCDFIKRLYPAAFAVRNDPLQYFAGLVQGPLKYATDPRYVALLSRCYRDLQQSKEISSLLK